MAAQKQEEQRPADREKHAHQRLQVVIGEQVMFRLGQPSNPQRIQVRLLWDDHYRVNIYVGADAGSATIAHSYFLLTDADGNIIASTPVILRQYLPETPTVA